LKIHLHLPPETEVGEKCIALKIRARWLA